MINYALKNRRLGDSQQSWKFDLIGLELLENKEDIND
jgi:hypothetical protein